MGVPACTSRLELHAARERALVVVEVEVELEVDLEVELEVEAEVGLPQYAREWSPLWYSRHLLKLSQRLASETQSDPQLVHLRWNLVAQEERQRR